MPSGASAALAQLYKSMAATIPPDNVFVSRCIYDQVHQAAAECPSVSFTDTVLAGTSIPCKWARPPNAPADRVLLFFHGGAYGLGSPNAHRKLAAHLARACNAAALIVDYRLAPEHPYPAALDDCVAAYAWLLEHGFAPEHIVVAGDSSGGALAVSAPIAAAQKGHPMPRAAVALSPWCDLTSSGPSLESNADKDAFQTKPFLQTFAERFAGQTPLSDPFVSPLFSDELHAIPPTWVSCGDCDMLRDDGVRLAQKARRAGAEVVLEVHEGQQHVFEFMAGKAPEADESLRKIGEWVRGKIES